MTDATLASLTREQLEAEVLRLRALPAGIADAASVHQKSEVDPTEPAFDTTSQLKRRQHADHRDLVSRGKARSRAVLESTTEFAIVVMDPAGTITNWNPGAEQVMGWSANEMIGEDASRFFTPQDLANGRLALEMARAIHDGHAQDERWHLRKDGQRFWASGEMMGLTDDNGEHLGFVKILRDRTAEHLAGIALKETQERFRIAAEATNDTIWDWDLVGDTVLWNEALKVSYGYQASDIAPGGRWRFEQIHPDDRARTEQSIHAVIEGTGSDWSEEYRFRRSDGSYGLVLDRGRVIRDSCGRAVG